MKILVVGGGNSTPIFATLAKTAGHEVMILTRKPEAWSKNLGFVNEDKGYLDGVEKMECEVDLITSDASACVPQADMIIIAGIPVHHNKAVLTDMIAPHVDREKKVIIASICCYGAFHLLVGEALGKGNYIISSTQLIPWCCGTKEYGKLGVVFGAKRMLRVVTESGEDEEGLVALFKGILRIDDMRVTDFLEATLHPNSEFPFAFLVFPLFLDFGVHPLLLLYQCTNVN